MGFRTAAGMSLVEVAGIRVDCKDHVTRTVGDSIFWVRGNIVEELVDIISGGLCGHELLGANGAESDKKFVVDRASIPQEDAKNTLDAFNAVCVKWRARIRGCRFLGLGTV